MSTILPPLPGLPTFAESIAGSRRPPRGLQSAFGFGDAGKDFNFDSGVFDFGGAFDFGTGSFIFGPGSSGGGYPIDGFDLGTAIRNGLGTVIGGVGSTVGTVTGTTGLGTAASLLGIHISWSRIAAFLLGLLLIAGGLYLIKPIQQTVNVSVRRAGEALAE